MSGDFVRRLPGERSGFRDHRGEFTWFNLDPWLLLILLSIVSFGLIVLYSASEGNWMVIEAQLVRLGLGFGLMVAIAQIPPYFFLRTAPFLYLIGLVLLLLIYPFGTEVNGSVWLKALNLTTLGS